MKSVDYQPKICRFHRFLVNSGLKLVKLTINFHSRGRIQRGNIIFLRIHGFQWKSTDFYVENNRHHWNPWISMVLVDFGWKTTFLSQPSRGQDQMTWKPLKLINHRFWKKSMEFGKTPQILVNSGLKLVKLTISFHSRGKIQRGNIIFLKIHGFQWKSTDFNLWSLLKFMVFTEIHGFYQNPWFLSKSVVFIKICGFVEICSFHKKWKDLTWWEAWTSWLQKSVTKIADFGMENCGFWWKPQILVKTWILVENTVFGLKSGETIK